MKKKIILSLICLAAVLFIAVIVIIRKEAGVQKFIMPGTYSVQVEPGFYGVWYFRCWPTKGINNPEKSTEITLTDQSNRPIEHDPGCSEPRGSESTHWQNIGRELFRFEARNHEILTVVCKMRFPEQRE